MPQHSQQEPPTNTKRHRHDNGNQGTERYRNQPSHHAVTYGLAVPQWPDVEDVHLLF
jgi:hypothetical protein